MEYGSSVGWVWSILSGLCGSSVGPSGRCIALCRATHTATGAGASVAVTSRATHACQCVLQNRSFLDRPIKGHVQIQSEQVAVLVLQRLMKQLETGSAASRTFMMLASAVYQLESAGVWKSRARRVKMLKDLNQIRREMLGEPLLLHLRAQSRRIPLSDSIAVRSTLQQMAYTNMCTQLSCYPLQCLSGLAAEYACEPVCDDDILEHSIVCQAGASVSSSKLVKGILIDNVVWLSSASADAEAEAVLDRPFRFAVVSLASGGTQDGKCSIEKQAQVHRLLEHEQKKELRLVETFKRLSITLVFIQGPASPALQHWAKQRRLSLVYGLSKTQIKRLLHVHNLHHFNWSRCFDHEKVLVDVSEDMIIGNADSLEQVLPSSTSKNGTLLLSSDRAHFSIVLAAPSMGLANAYREILCRCISELREFLNQHDSQAHVYAISAGAAAELSMCSMWKQYGRSHPSQALHVLSEALLTIPRHLYLNMSSGAGSDPQHNPAAKRRFAILQQQLLLRHSHGECVGILSRHHLFEKHVSIDDIAVMSGLEHGAVEPVHVAYEMVNLVFENLITLLRVDHVLKANANRHVDQ